MNLQTKISIPSQAPKIGYHSDILSLGSCFAENIGSRFEYFKFKNLINPFGVLFHPKAIENFLWMATQGEQYTDADLFYYNEQWHCFDAHSSLSGANKSEVVSTLNQGLKHTREKIKKATHIFVTLGTAWGYRLKRMDIMVANCHKIPQKEFDKELMSVAGVEKCIKNCDQLIKSLNPSASIIFAVSPVRHLKDGHIENTRSKSHLITAVHQYVSSNANSYYFPSYEIMMDELREYRFYKEDMIHPNAIAIQYIWERFSTAWIDENAIRTMKAVDEIRKGMAHKPFNPSSNKHQEFLERLELKKHRLQERYSFITF